MLFWVITQASVTSDAICPVVLLRVFCFVLFFALLFFCLFSKEGKRKDMELGGWEDKDDLGKVGEKT